MSLFQKVDPIIKSHGVILAESSSLNSKVMYSISCLQSNIEFQNVNRNANINYLQSIVPSLIALGEKSEEISEDHLKCLLRLINSLLT
jgi:predicted HNH restriction endonuclease